MKLSALHRELPQVQDELLKLGLMVGQALIESVEALAKADMESAHRIISADKDFNKNRDAIESQALVLIARHQPVANDLRMIAALLKISSELERIGDYAKGVAKITIKMGVVPRIKPPPDILVMADVAYNMLKQALRAFVEQNIEAAKAIIAIDDEIDTYYDRVFRELMTHVIDDPGLIEYVNYLVWVAHNLERSADRVVNICRRIVFTFTGELLTG